MHAGQENPFQSPDTQTPHPETLRSLLARRSASLILFAIACFSIAAGCAATLAALGLLDAEQSPLQAAAIALVWAVVGPTALLLSIFLWRKRVPENVNMPQTARRALFGSGGASLLNAIAVVANIALLVVNLVWSGATAAKSGLLNPNAPQASREAEARNMDLALIRDPLALFVDKDFPKTPHYLLVDQSAPVLISGYEADPEYHEDAERSLSLALGEDFEMACSYALADGLRVQEIRLNTREASFFDFQADGVYDVRIVPSGESQAALLQVWYENQWRDVDRAKESSKYEKTLDDGTEVRFDRDKGRWLPTP